jgi:hypothetical protein
MVFNIVQEEISNDGIVSGERMGKYIHDTIRAGRGPNTPCKAGHEGRSESRNFAGRSPRDWFRATKMTIAAIRLRYDGMS